MDKNNIKNLNNKYSMNDIENKENLKDNNYDNKKYNYFELNIKNIKKIGFYDANFCNGESFIKFKNSIKIPITILEREKNLYDKNINIHNIKDEKNYQLKRFRFLKNYKYCLNSEIREKNIKIIQKFYRNIIKNKINYRNKIIKIQTYFKGFILRKKYKQILKMYKIMKEFINKLKSILTKFVRKNYFPEKNYKKYKALLNIKNIKLKQYLIKWKIYIKNINLIQNYLLKIKKFRENNRNNLIIIKNYFNIWKLKTNFMIFEIKNNKNLKNEIEKQKKLLNFINNVKKFLKKNSFNKCYKKIIEYLQYLIENKKEINKKNKELKNKLKELENNNYNNKEIIKNFENEKKNNLNLIENLKKEINENKNIISSLKNDNKEKQKIINDFKQLKNQYLNKIKVLENNNKENLNKIKNLENKNIILNKNKNNEIDNKNIIEYENLIKNLKNEKNQNLKKIENLNQELIKNSNNYKNIEKENKNNENKIKELELLIKEKENIIKQIENEKDVNKKDRYIISINNRNNKIMLTNEKLSNEELNNDKLKIIDIENNENIDINNNITNYLNDDNNKINNELNFSFNGDYNSNENNKNKLLLISNTEPNFKYKNDIINSSDHYFNINTLQKNIYNRLNNIQKENNNNNNNKIDYYESLMNHKYNNNNNSIHKIFDNNLNRNFNQKNFTNVKEKKENINLNYFNNNEENNNKTNKNNSSNLIYDPIRGIYRQIDNNCKKNKKK